MSRFPRAPLIARRNPALARLGVVLSFGMIAGILVSCNRSQAQESHADFFRQDRAHWATQVQPKQQAPRMRRAPPTQYAGSLHGLMRSTAARNGVPANLLHGVIMTESRYNCSAYNRRGGVHGIGQVKPATARSVGVNGSLYDCQNGLEAAARYLRIAISRGGTGCAGVSLYERGVYARPICTAYGRTVMRNAGA